MDLDTIIYIVITIALIIISSMGKKKAKLPDQPDAGEIFNMPFETSFAEVTPKPDISQPKKSHKTEPFLTGTQENVLKVKKASQAAKQPPVKTKEHIKTPVRKINLREAIIYSEIMTPKYF